ncbi:vegetative cell wall protein gp1-like [Phyllostomus discolor]|uniref:Vegetative cell wall protein gp1-like n=1 Tax=Phyllostomus discolor TaxID=89673 RepID=A0A6J2KYK4_9CHIR|nr:vegetative cell wall protein gp1-like [Phyllostomus discolor]
MLLTKPCPSPPPQVVTPPTASAPRLPFLLNITQMQDPPRGLCTHKVILSAGHPDCTGLTPAQRSGGAGLGRGCAPTNPSAGDTPQVKHASHARNVSAHPAHQRPALEQHPPRRRAAGAPQLSGLRQQAATPGETKTGVRLRIALTPPEGRKACVARPDVLTSRGAHLTSRRAHVTLLRPRLPPPAPAPRAMPAIPTMPRWPQPAPRRSPQLICPWPPPRGPPSCPNGAPEPSGTDLPEAWGPKPSPQSQDGLGLLRCARRYSLDGRRAQQTRQPERPRAGNPERLPTGGQLGDILQWPLK